MGTHHSHLWQEGYEAKFLSPVQTIFSSSFSVVIIDAYPTTSYITPSPSQLQPPIRYLRTWAASKDVCISNHPHTCSAHDELKSPLQNAEPFQPPNLIQSPAASFLSILESSTHATPATLFLLPLSHVSSPAPSELEGNSGPELREEWEPSTLAKLHGLVCSVLGIDSPWSAQHFSDRSIRVKALRRGDIGEGGMYI
jgi:hypothetical protein